jgi:small membrane protein
MLQQVIAIVFICFFVFRLFWQKKKGQIKNDEFGFWLIFWIIAAIAILFIKQIDTVVASLGFSSSGISILFYIAVFLLFYFIFRLRLRIERIEKNITKIVRESAIKGQN